MCSLSPYGDLSTHLMPDEIVATLDVVREGERVRSAVHWIACKLLAVCDALYIGERTDVLLDPGRAVALLADFVDLEPLSVRSIKLVARRVPAGRHVREHRAGVVWPL